MFEANIKITEKDMTWGELKTLCESKKLRISSMALLDDQGAVVPETPINIPPGALCAIHFKTAEAQFPSGNTELIVESVGYANDSPNEVINQWYRKSGKVVSNESATLKNVIHGIKMRG